MAWGQGHHPESGRSARYRIQVIWLFSTRTKRNHMYSLVSRLGLRTTVKSELFPLIGSVVIAEMLYKFHSFSLECLAFLATWYVLSAAQNAIERTILGKRSEK